MGVEKYISKPKIITAIEITGDNYDELLEFASDDVFMKKDKQMVKTLEGEYELKKGWYLIKGIHGEFYPCEPEIFNKSYSKIT